MSLFFHKLLLSYGFCSRKDFFIVQKNVISNLISRLYSVNIIFSDTEALEFVGNSGFFLNSFDKLRIAFNLKLLNFDLGLNSLSIKKSRGASLFYTISKIYIQCLQGLLNTLSLPAIENTSYKFSFAYGSLCSYSDFSFHINKLLHNCFFNKFIWVLNVEVFFHFSETSKYWLLKNFPLPSSLIKPFLYLNNSIIFPNTKLFLYSSNIFFSFYAYILNGLV